MKLVVEKFDYEIYVNRLIQNKTNLFNETIPFKIEGNAEKTLAKGAYTRKGNSFDLSIKALEKNWLTKNIIDQIISLPFYDKETEEITATIKISNITALRLVKGIGFKTKKVVRINELGAHGIHYMTREDVDNNKFRTKPSAINWLKTTILTWLTYFNLTVKAINKN